MARPLIRLAPLGLAVVVAVALLPGTAYAASSWTENFNSVNTANWSLYDGPGHDGQGLRKPSQITATNGVLKITGTANGTTGGMKWRNHSQTYGQWDIHMRTKVGCICYHPVVLLWGSDGGSGVDNPLGEIDIVEVWQRSQRDINSFTIHYGDGSQMVGADTPVTMTTWHTYHVVWQGQYVYTWVDDLAAYYTTNNVNVIPHGPMDLTIQLDWFPQEGTAGGTTATMEVDYVTQFVNPVVY